MFSTMESIAQAASNSLFIFCFCNLILFIILVTASKPASCCHQKNQVPLLTVTNANMNVKQANTTKHFPDVSKVSNAAEAQIQENANDDHSRENNEDDEFRRKVEEFIDKVNRGWKTELLRKSKSLENNLQQLEL
ncbi:hypothetical protein P3X46_028691 [Hevea brasiliensis]|uniref:Uncharacterized protein n=1 Tax=Hevea brasiliensis TaxID=3981 RepID=A0ABQ9KRB2_HEVBR|nr:hypothetical protein P3X46_028691 [Hevea brasiliensis]